MNRESEAAMRQKYYIWGFPGIGKTSANSKLRIEDADCERFKFLVSEDVPLHLREAMEQTRRDLAYPKNYWNYVRAVDADVVLLNCHISLLSKLDRERLLLVYPAPELKGEYLRRYAQRGDNESYIRYMETAFEEIVAAVKHSPYRKYEVTDPHIYLHDLIERGTIMARGALFFEIARLAEAKRPAYLTAPILVPRTQESACSLSDILIPDAPAKYFLSSEQTEKLLYNSSAGRRAPVSTTPGEPPAPKPPERAERAEKQDCT